MAGRARFETIAESSDADGDEGTFWNTRRKMEELEQQMDSFRLLSASGKKGRAASRHDQSLQDASFKLSDLQRQDVSASQKRQEEIRVGVRRAKALDLAFLVDATGSMQDSIDMVKREVASMAAGIVAAHPGSELRVALAGYRDYGDDHCEWLDFTTSFQGRGNAFSQFLSRVRASGGDDEAEDVFSGLEIVATLSWEAANRVLVHIGDAPCHGRKFHDGVQDSYPRGDPRGRNIGTILEKLRNRCRISSYFFCHLNDSTRRMVAKFKKAVGGEGWIQEHEFDNIRDIPTKVIDVSTETITRTLHTLGSSGIGATASLRDTKFLRVEVRAGFSAWQDIPLQPCQQLKNKWFDSLDDLLEAVSSKRNLEVESMPPAQVQIALWPFTAEGALRWPVYARVHNLAGGTVLDMVVKRFKMAVGQNFAVAHRKHRYLEQMEVQSVAAQMAREFNKQTSSIKAAKRVTFTLVSTLEAGSKVYNMEKLLRGDWIKYSSNAGYVNTADYAATLQAFSHWTHERSRGLLMVTDLQGVMMLTPSAGERVFWLCDPAIHCTDLMRFTRTNLGKEGFQLFYNSHICNHVCLSLDLKPTWNGYT